MQAELSSKLDYLKEQTLALLNEAAADPLTPHEILLGTAYLYTQRCNFLSAVPTKRATGKKADPANVFQLLAIFAVAAWMEMIERWWNKPTSPEGHLNGMQRDTVRCFYTWTTR